MGAAASAQSQMRQEHDPNSAFPWWVRLLAKGLGVVGGFGATFHIFLNSFTQRRNIHFSGGVLCHFGIHFIQRDMHRCSFAAIVSNEGKRDL